MTTISILIPTRGERQRLEACLNSLYEQTFDSVEILICPNNQVEDITNTNAKVRLLPPTTGVNAARNLGLREARGDILFFLDDDCRLHHKDFLANLAQAFDDHPTVSGIGGPYLIPPTANVFERVYNLNALEWMSSSQYGKENKFSRFLLGGNFAIRASLVKNVSFDENIPWGGSELSFFLSAAKQRHIFLYIEKLSVLHDCRIHLFDFLRKLQKQKKRTQLYLRQGLLPDPNTTSRASEGSRNIGLMDRLVFKLVQLVFADHKISRAVLLFFWPLRLIPKKSVNSLYNEISALAISRSIRPQSPESTETQTLG